MTVSFDQKARNRGGVWQAVGSLMFAKMATRMNPLRQLWRLMVAPTKSTVTSLSLLVASACAVDTNDSGSSCKNLTQLKLLNRKEMTHEALIRQACLLTANSSTQLLTQVLVAISDTSKEYREAMSILMGLLEESIMFLSNANTVSLDEVEDLIVEQRNIVDEQRRLLQELISLMEYVEKMVTSTAETAYLAGAEHSSTMMCERLNSALNKVLEESATNKKSEEDLLKLQEAYIVKLGELYQRHGHENDESQSIPSTGNIVSPIELFEDSSADGHASSEECHASVT